MRKVTFYSAGWVGEFRITDTSYEKFLHDLDEAQGIIDAHSEDDLMKARAILDSYMLRAREDEEIAQGPGEVLAASFVWNFFNTHPDASQRIEGDIVILDVDGTLSMVQYTAAKDVQLPHDHD